MAPILEYIMYPALERNNELLKKFSPDSPFRIKAELYPVFPDLVDNLIDQVYGFAYSRGIIDLKTRHLISLGVLSAMGGCENQLEFQLDAALNLGITPDEIKEVFIQVTVFAGNARAINASIVLSEILDKRKEK